MCMIVQLYSNYSDYYYMEFVMNISKLQLVEDLLVQLLQAHNRPQLSFILNFPNKLCYLENLFK